MKIYYRIKSLKQHLSGKLFLYERVMSLKCLHGLSNTKGNNLNNDFTLEWEKSQDSIISFIMSGVA